MPPKKTGKASKKSQSASSTATGPTAQAEQPVVCAAAEPVLPAPKDATAKKRVSKSKKAPAHQPTAEEIEHAHLQVDQAIAIGVSGPVSSASQTGLPRTIAPLPPPLQTRRAKKMAEAQAQVQPPSASELPVVAAAVPSNADVSTPTPAPATTSQRPTPRPIPAGLELSSDSDNGFAPPKHRAKFQRALERLASKIPDTILQTVPAAPVNPDKAPRTQHQPVLANAHDQRRDRAAQRPVLPSRSAEAGSTSASATADTRSDVPPSELPIIPAPSVPATSSGPQRPIGAVSPGGRHYSGLFPSGTGTTKMVSSTGAPSFSSTAAPTVSSTAAPHQHSTSPCPEEDCPLPPSPTRLDEAIRRVCIRNGLHPVDDFDEVKLAYEAAGLQGDEQWDESDGTHDKCNKSRTSINDSGNNGAGNNTGENPGSDYSGDDSGDSDDGDSSNDAGGDSNDDEPSDTESNCDGRYDDEIDAWLIDPDTDIATRPCAYHFQTSKCAVRYYGPAPEWSGQSGVVERFTKFRLDDTRDFRRVPGGYVVPRYHVRQRADARRESDRIHAELVAQGKALLHDDDDDSDSDYGTTQDRLKSEGKPADSDLENDEDDSSPTKPKDKGKGRAQPILPLPSTLKLGSTLASTGRPSNEEIEACTNLGAEVHQQVLALAERYKRTPMVILNRAGLALCSTRNGNFWNSFQTWYTLKVPDTPRDAEWHAKCKAAYTEIFPEGLPSEQRDAREVAIYAQLDAIAEDPNRAQSPASRMKSAIAEARKLSQTERYAPDLVRVSAFIYTGPDPVARQLNCVVSPSSIFKAALERNQIMLQPLLDMAVDIVRQVTEVALQQVNASTMRQNESATSKQPTAPTVPAAAMMPATTTTAPAFTLSQPDPPINPTVPIPKTTSRKTPEPSIDDNMDELHRFASDHLLILHRDRNEPRRMYEEALKLDPKARTGKYRHIITNNLLKECNILLPNGFPEKSTFPFQAFARWAEAWQIRIKNWSDDVHVWPGCPRSISAITAKQWEDMCKAYIDNPNKALAVEQWTDEEKTFRKGSSLYGHIPLVVSVGGSPLLIVEDGGKTLRKPRAPAKPLRAVTLTTTVVPAMPKDPIVEEVQEAEETQDAEEDPISDPEAEMAVDNQEPLSDYDPIADDDLTDHEGQVVYRIRSQSPQVPANPRKRRHEDSEVNDDHLYAWDAVERRDRHTDPAQSSRFKKVKTVSPLPFKPAIKRTRLLDNSDNIAGTQEHPKVVRIELPPDHDMRVDRRRDIKHLTQLRTARPPTAPPRHSHSIVPLPVRQHPMNTSTDAFYRAMGGPPPSNQPLAGVQRVPSCSTQAGVARHAHPAMSRHSYLASSRPVQPSTSRYSQPATSRPVVAHPDQRLATSHESDEDVFTSRRNVFPRAPAARFDQQRYVREGQAGPSNERFLQDDCASD